MSLSDTPILTYHQITEEDPPTDPYRMAISVSQFERQMSYLHDHGYHCLSLTELLYTAGDTSFRRKKAFILTFDDGYADFFKNAYPILRRYGFTATVFLVTDFVGGQSDWDGDKGSPMLTWEEIKGLHEDGISFGSHTCTHPWLTHLSGEQIWHEFTTSKERLEAKLGQEIHLLAYPYGYSNPRIQKMTMEAGYKAAFGVTRGGYDCFNLWRCLLGTNDNLLSLRFKLSQSYRFLKCLRDETIVGKSLRTVKRSWFHNHD